MSKRFSASCILTVLCVLAVSLAGIGLQGSPNGTEQPKTWGFDTANLDKTCKPCDDFYQFAMGGWMKANPIPPEYSVWGSFSQLLDKNQKNLREILEAAAVGKVAQGATNRRLATSMQAAWTPRPLTRQEPNRSKRN